GAGRSGLRGGRRGRLERRGGADAAAGGGVPPVRSRGRPSSAGGAGAAGWRKLPSPRRAPRRGRFLVNRRAGPRARRAGGGRDAPHSSGSVYRLRPPSGADAGEPRGRAVVGALAGAFGRRAATRPAHRSAAASGAVAARRRADAPSLAGAGGGGPSAGRRPWL